VVARALGMSPPVIAEASRLLGFPPGFLRRLSQHRDLVESVARELDARTAGTAAQGGSEPQ
jgi:hypothetical protein